MTNEKMMAFGFKPVHPPGKLPKTKHLVVIISTKYGSVLLNIQNQETLKHVRMLWAKVEVKYYSLTPEQLREVKRELRRERKKPPSINIFEL